MIKTIKQYLQTMKHWLNKISDHNNKTTKITENLQIALLNLKIQQAYLGDEAKGILPIADLIEKSIKELHDSTQDLVNAGRKELRESFNEIEKYINSKEDK